MVLVENPFIRVFSICMQQTLTAIAKHNGTNLNPSSKQGNLFDKEQSYFFEDIRLSFIMK